MRLQFSLSKGYLQLYGLRDSLTSSCFENSSQENCSWGGSSSQLYRPYQSQFSVGLTSFREATFSPSSPLSFSQLGFSNGERFSRYAEGTSSGLSRWDSL